MPTKTQSEQTGRQDSIHLLILLAVALCIGVYLISTTVLISKDGVTFIEYTKHLAVSGVDTMLGEYQHPGYPALILAFHRIGARVFGETALSGWIYSAQIAALTFRLLALAAVYYIGKTLIGARQSFWAVLILIVLPKPAGYGSDALSDWPHLFFLTTGLLVLLRGARDAKWWWFGLAGILAGIGYLIRPECAQLVVYGALWLGLCFVWPKPIAAGRKKAALALMVLVVGFAAVAGPYMKLKGGIFPKKHVGEFSSKIQSCDEVGVYTAALAAPDSMRALAKFAENIGSTLMWFFIPALVIGLYERFRGQKWYEPEKVFIAGLIVLNMAVMVWLYDKHGYMSQRHTLPLLVCTIFYIPVGLQALSAWLAGRFSAVPGKSWFVILLLIGICVCVPHLLRPLNDDRKSYKAAALWLAANTDKNEVIAVPDVRISFYADRKGLKYDGDAVPEGVQYIVRIFKKRTKSDLSEKTPRQENLLFSTVTDSDNPVVAVYRRMK
ncbi:MAG: glycosyltransferase family 39 protein [Sedimentisphaerales bacterium]|nr:glycosyltransferase family 39 protein [Sedimentisphaerales bacterium]